MPTWLLRLDRRTDRREEVVDELRALAATVRGLSVEVIDEGLFEAAPDAGKYRDFVPAARLTHADSGALELVAEEIIDLFGWLIDVGPDPHPLSEPQE